MHVPREQTGENRFSRLSVTKTSKRVETRDARKRSKKTSKKVEKLTCPLFSWLRVPETTVFIAFSAPLENKRRKKPNLSLLPKPLHRKKTQKTTYLRTRCRLRKHYFCSGFARMRNWGSFKLS